MSSSDGFSTKDVIWFLSSYDITQIHGEKICMKKTHHGVCDADYLLCQKRENPV